LPPYSPDLNPIEEAFAQLKQWYRTNRDVQEDLPMEDFIELGLIAVSKNVKSHFSKARIGMPVRTGVDEDYFDD